MYCAHYSLGSVVKHLTADPGEWEFDPPSHTLKLPKKGECMGSFQENAPVYQCYTLDTLKNLVCHVWWALQYLALHVWATNRNNLYAPRPNGNVQTYRRQEAIICSWLLGL